MKIILLTIIYITWITTLGCKEKTKTQIIIPETKIKSRQAVVEIKEYYKRKNWAYPIDVSFEIIDFQKTVKDSLASLENFDTATLKNELLKWAVNNYGKHDEAIRISNFFITKSTLKKLYLFNCKVCFYRKGEYFSDGLIAPIEGHGIIERSFYRQVEYPHFYYDTDKLRFLNWGG